ncbi:MAG: glycosyltransferase [Deltaproteobacteria bacterium]|nr:glycosyltransferase [Deltaproteobacteria bacterium]
MDISIIIVNWNTREDILKCLVSIYKFTKGISFEVIVSDNGSIDGSVEAIREVLPEVRIIENGANLGFGRANNRALGSTVGRYVLFLNSDTIVTDGAISDAVAYLDENPRAGLVGVQLLNEDCTLQNSIANTPTIATELLNKSLLRKLFPSRYPGKEHNFTSPKEVDSVVGAAIFVRKEALDDVSTFDESFFFFLEETDLCLRLRQAGWKVLHHPGIRIFHSQGKSAKKVNTRARIEYWISRNMFFRKHYGALTNTALFVGLIAKLTVNIILLLTLNIVTFFALSKQRNKLALNLMILCWHLFGRPTNWGLRGGTGVMTPLVRHTLVWSSVDDLTEQDSVLNVPGELVRRVPGRQEVWKVKRREGEAVFIKRVAYNSWPRRLKGTVFGTSLSKELQGILKASDAGLNTAKVLGFGTVKDFLIREDVLVTEAVKGAVSIKELKFNDIDGITISEAFEEVLASNGLCGFEKLFGFEGGEFEVEREERSVVRFEVKDKNAGLKVFYLKRHTGIQKRSIKSMITRGSEDGRNEWEMMISLLRDGFLTMTPVAYGQKKEGGLQKSLTLTEEIYNGVRVEDYIPTLAAKGKDGVKEKRKVIGDVGRLARRFHDAGYNHQDFYLGHIFITPASGELFLIDLQRVQKRERVGKKWVVKDLSQLVYTALICDNFSSTDLVRFAYAYLGKAGFDKDDKKMIKEILAKAERISRHTVKLLRRKAEKAKVK